MVKFDILTVSADSTKLIIGASMLEMPYYDNMYISKIFIDTQDTYEDGRPSSKAWEYRVEDEAKSVYLEIQYQDLDVDNRIFPSLERNLFFVYVECSGTPTADTPCGFDKQYTLGTAYNTCLIRQQLMYYVKQVANTCTIPKKFIDLFLRSKALEVSLCQAHYPEAIKFFLDFVKEPRLWKDNPDTFRNLLDGFTMQDALTKNCGCHG